MGNSAKLAEFAAHLNTNFFIDSDGQVGIDASPYSKLHVVLPDNDGNVGAWDQNTVAFGQTGSAGAALGFAYSSTNNSAYMMALEPGVAWKTMGYRALDHRFYYNGTSEGARLNSSGKLIVGETAVVGNETFRVNGSGRFTTDASAVSFYWAGSMRDTGGSGNVYLDFNTGGSAGNIIFRNGSGFAEQLRVDGNGNVGINNDNPAKTLDVAGTIKADTQFQADTSDSASTPGYSWDGDADTGFFWAGVNILGISTAGSEVSRFLADGTQVWGATLEGTSGSVAINNAGYVHAARNGIVSYFDRKSTSGYITEWRSDGTTVGAVGNIGTAGCFVGNSDTGLAYRPDSVALYPYNPAGLAGRDNAIDLGVSGARFDDIYATNGTIQTSDERLKTDIRDLTEAESRVAMAIKGMMKAYRWIESVEEKGDDARIHFGAIAQQVQAAFAAEGLDAGRYALFIHDHWFVDPDDGQIYKEQNEAGTREAHDRMGIRYPELLAFIIAAL